MKNSNGGNAYAQHLLAEHRRLDQLMHRTIITLPGWEEADAVDWLPRTVGGLQAIRQEVARHFRDEEAGGCLEEAVANCPSLAAEADGLLHEHPGLLKALDDLIARYEQLVEPTPEHGRALAEELRAVLKKLRQHEALENRLIERAFASGECAS
jgi:hypothetical protein